MFSSAHKLFSTGMLMAAPLLFTALFASGCADPCKSEKENCRKSGGSPSCASSGCLAACVCSCTPDNNADATMDPLAETTIQENKAEQGGAGDAEFSGSKTVGLAQD